jgi:linoleoyl-CoA desaturase
VPLQPTVVYLLMGWRMIGIGTSVMHDAHLGTYFTNNNIYGLVGYIVEDIGSYGVTWKIQLKILHHRYANITGLDDDIHSITF